MPARRHGPPPARGSAPGSPVGTRSARRRDRCRSRPARSRPAPASARSLTRPSTRSPHSGQRRGQVVGVRLVDREADLVERPGVRELLGRDTDSVIRSMPIVSITAWATQRDISSSPSSRASADSVTNALFVGRDAEPSTGAVPGRAAPPSRARRRPAWSAPAAVDEVSLVVVVPARGQREDGERQGRGSRRDDAGAAGEPSEPSSERTGGTAGVMGPVYPAGRRAEPGTGPRLARRPNVVVMQGLMQDVPLTVIQLFERAEQVFAHKVVDDGDADRPPAPRPTGTGRSGPVGSAACSTPSASRPTAGWGRSPGTRRGTSSCTSPRPAPDGCCTRSTSACSPNS